MQNPYRLSKEVIPIKYNIEIQPDFKDLTFSGKEEIEIEILKDTKEITLNAKDINITKCDLSQNALKEIKYDKKYETATFYFKDKIKKGKILLKIEYNAKVSTGLAGFYKSTYKNNGKEEVMLTTHFEATDARMAFPCFDEPGLKARFNISLIIPKVLEGVSNMPLKSESNFGNLRKLVFEETPVMSTYLVAFIIGKIEYLEGKTKNNVLVRILTTPGNKNKAKFPLKVAVKALEYYEDYFKIPYPLPKLDLIAIPDFEFGAMENWGLITYREIALLVDEEHSSIGTKQNVTTVICHELAHQWFGNLVTMKWWDDLWLNEGFASWMEYKSTNILSPEFDIWTEFLTDERIPVLNLDSLNSSHPIEMEVLDPGKIAEIFDAISYNKGSCIIRMLEEYLGEERFREGLYYYLNKFKYGNATTEELWDSLEYVSKKPVKQMMNSWTKQTGYPMISINLNNNKLKLRQERFFYLNQKNSQLWNIPIEINVKGKKTYYLMTTKEAEIDFSYDMALNKSQVGFYRIKYEEKLFNKLINSKLSFSEKLGLLNDTYALARGSYIKIENYLKLVYKFRNETNHAIWDDISSSLARIELLFSDKCENNLDNFKIKVYENIFKKVGWDEKKNDSPTDIMLRANVLGNLGLAGHKEIIKEANKGFSEFLKGKKLNPNIRAVVYGMAVFDDGSEVFNKIKNIYIKEEFQEEKMRLLLSLGATRKEELMKELLEFGLSNHVRSQDTVYTLSTIGGNIKAGDIAWQFFKKNWGEFSRRYLESHMMAGLIKSCTLRFNALEKLKDIEEFFKKHDAPTAKIAIQQVLEIIKINKNVIDYNKEINFGNVYS